MHMAGSRIEPAKRCNHPGSGRDRRQTLSEETLPARRDRVGVVADPSVILVSGSAGSCVEDREAVRRLSVPDGVFSVSGSAIEAAGVDSGVRSGPGRKHRHDPRPPYRTVLPTHMNRSRSLPIAIGEVGKQSAAVCLAASLDGPASHAASASPVDQTQSPQGATVAESVAEGSSSRAAFARSVSGAISGAVAFACPLDPRRRRTRMAGLPACRWPPRLSAITGRGHPDDGKRSRLLRGFAGEEPVDRSSRDADGAADKDAVGVAAAEQVVRLPTADVEDLSAARRRTAHRRDRSASMPVPARSGRGRHLADRCRHSSSKKISVSAEQLAPRRAVATLRTSVTRSTPRFRSRRPGLGTASIQMARRISGDGNRRALRASSRAGS